MPLDSSTNGNNAEVPIETDEVSLMEEVPSIRFQRRDSFLFNTQIPFWKYIIRMSLLSLLPSLLLAGLLAAAGVINEETAPSFKIPPGVPPEVFYPLVAVGFVFCAPVVETLLLGFTLWALSFITENFTRRALGAAVIWGILHSTSAPAWGLIVWWPFFVFSCAYLAWRRASWPHAFLAGSLIHLIQNILPAVAVLTMV